MKAFAEMSLLRRLLLGQVISALIAGTGIFSTFLADAGINVPTTQSLLNYVLLMGYAAWRVYKEGTAPLRAKPWKYFLLALADVEANTLIVAAYQHTSITSVMLLDCATIPTCMLLSHFYLGTRFTRQHIVGVAIGFVGIVCLAWSDSSNDSGVYPNALWGDALCLGAATLYAISNVGQEVCLREGHGARVEFLGAIGVAGTAISSLQVLVMERGALAAMTWTPRAVADLLGFALCLWCMYTLTSFFLSDEGEAPPPSASLSGMDSLGCQPVDAGSVAMEPPQPSPATPHPAQAVAQSRPAPVGVAQGFSYSTLFNLSLLTSDLWAIVASVFLFSTPIQPWYYLALILVVCGLAIYHRASGVQALAQAGERQAGAVTTGGS